MQVISQIIERNLHQRAHCGAALWMNPDKNDSWRKAQANCDTLKLFCQDYGTYDFLLQSGAEVEFAAFPAIPQQKYQWIILHLPRQKALLGMLLDCAASLLADDGVLWLAGENQAGIKSADKLLKKHFGRVRKLDNARHCTLYEASGKLSEAPFDALAYREQWLLDFNTHELKVVSYPGVFAHGRLDAGSALLLEALAIIQPEGDVLDFACGAGIIGACVALSQADTRVTLLDTDAIALKACEQTLAANQLEGTLLASDGLSEVTDSYDLIVSNPPIHTGVKTDSRLSMRLLDSVHEHIRPGGMLLMVANVHLPYENWLSKKFKRSIEFLKTDHYKVILAKK